MTFGKLLEVLESNQINKSSDRAIIERILEAERDWVVPINNLNEFISLLKEEIGDIPTKSNLANLLKKYEKNGFQNSAWNAESICALLEIFELKNSDNLITVFEELKNNIEKKAV